ncbi:hypothetical protein E2C01_035681 [Portunus trituberculatus]|uniref:Uncharacterized protein n=1 Tax=Portunus trituberculatus TaxID=210409 RepID=A0A5B7F9Z7_PORTR|nr:hypothetical protein [Portunus trituberculatus]
MDSLCVLCGAFLVTPLLACLLNQAEDSTPCHARHQAMADAHIVTLSCLVIFFFQSPFNIWN